jgi:hypothetical protein
MKKLFAVVLVLTGCAIGQATSTPQAPKTAKGQTTLAQARTPEGNHTGRYQIFFSPHARADVYLLDTETGKIWRPVTITNAKDTNLNRSGVEVWVYQDRIDNEHEFDAWSASHPVPTPVTAQ